MSEGDALRELFLSEFAGQADGLRGELDMLGSNEDLEAHFGAAIEKARGLKAAALVMGQRALGGLAQELTQSLSELGGKRSPLDAATISVLRSTLDLLLEFAAETPADPALDKQQRFGRLLRSLLEPSRSAPRAGSALDQRSLPPPVRPKRPNATAAADGDRALLDIFSSEAESHAAALSSGLVELESGSPSASTLDKLMRAAHSLKGAARVIGLEEVVALAHAMEDRFVAAQQGSTLTSAEIDLLLVGADQLAAIAKVPSEELRTWLASSAESLRQLGRQISGLAAPAHGSAVALKLPSAPAPTALAPAAAAPVEARRAGDQRIVRVAAESINRLMGLAGESLVEARRVMAFGGSLQQLKQRQTALNDVLSDLEHLAGGDTDRLLARIGEAKQRALECREALGKRIAEFEIYTRRADDLSDRLYREAQKTRMRPFADGVQGVPRAVRDLGRKLGKQVKLEITGERTQVDRDVLESLDAPLNHLIRNAIDHGIEGPDERTGAGKPEQGSLRIEAHHRAGMLNIRIADDGRGIDAQRVAQKALDQGLITEQMASSLSEAEALEFLFLPGFSTARELTDISGRGVGLDVVRSAITAIGGSVSIKTEAGRGTVFLLQLPVTRSVLRAILVEIGGEPYAFPLLKIERVVRVLLDETQTMEGSQYIALDGKNIGLVRAEQVLRLELPASSTDELCVVVLGSGDRQVGVVVDRFLGEQDLVVRPLDARLGKVQDLAAAAILADGTPALIVDVDDVLRSIDKLIEAGRLERVRKGGAAAPAQVGKRILVVDDSLTVREVERQLLVNRGYSVDVAVDGVDGWNSVNSAHYDLVVTDLDMPRMSGIELVRAIKADSRLQSLPVVIVSYKDRDEDRLRGLEAGANYYLTKSSFHDDRFVLAVEELIGAPA